MEKLRIQMSKFSTKGTITEEDFMINILNNLTKEYHIILDCLEQSSGIDWPRYNNIWSDPINWITGTNKLKTKMKKKLKGEKLAAHSKQSKVGAISVAILGISQLTQNVQKRKMKEG